MHNQTSVDTERGIAIAGGALGAMAAVAAVPVAVAALGFGVAGPIAGSFAAAVQAAAGPLAAGGLFAGLQSAGMAGMSYAATALTATVGGTISFTATAAATDLISGLETSDDPAMKEHDK